MRRLLDGSNTKSASYSIGAVPENQPGRVQDLGDGPDSTPLKEQKTMPKIANKGRFGGHNLNYPVEIK